MRALCKGLCENNHLTVGVFSQRLRNFTQKPEADTELLWEKLSLFDPACVLLLQADGKP
jgi:hypothetical protein